MKPKGFFITGTDTGVGKTFVAAMIATTMRESGVDAIPFKPVETGCKGRKAELIPADIMFCNDMCGLPGDELALQSPYRFHEACSPHLAAERAGSRIDPKRIIRCFKELQKKHEVIITEGAGGVLVPITGRYLMVDLIKDLGLPVIIVARAGLGTINHTLATIEVLKRRRISIIGVILNQPHVDNNTHIIKDNIRVIRKLSGIRVLAALDHLKTT